MMVCSCNLITDRDIEATIRDLLFDDPWVLVVPLQVYRAMEKRGKCCGCFGNVVEIIIRVTEQVHLELETPADARLIHLDQIRAEHRRQERMRVEMRRGQAA
jgi:bacterioferritin-associated ferredoxin